MNPVEAMCNSYLRQSYVQRIDESSYEVTLPVLDRFNDWLSIKVSISGSRCRISDMGFVVDDLDLAGITYTPDGATRFDAMIDRISNNLMCRFNSDESEFFIECDLDEMGDKMLYFLQGISHMDFLAYNTQGFVSTGHVRFRFTVSSYFRSKGVDGVRDNPEFRGSRNRKVAFSFQMPNASIVDLLSENNANLRYAIMYKWDEAKKGDLRFHHSPLFVIENYETNDKYRDISEAMDESRISLLPWSDKKRIDRYLLGA